jgi:DNA-binding protein YbaB
MPTMENLTNMGQDARKSFIKASHGNAQVFFKIPMQIVKVENTDPKEGYSKINRLLVKAINGAYGTVMKELSSLQKNNPSPEESQAFAKKTFTVMAEDQMAVVIGGDLRVQQIGLQTSDLDAGELKAYFNDVIQAANDGAIAAHKKGIELIAKNI